jgi:hypothetical protein
MNQAKNDGGMLGRALALALILGAVYGVHAISRGGMGCPLGEGASCCAMGHHHDEAAEGDEHRAAAKGHVADEADEDAKIEAKAPVTPPAKDED